MTTRLRPIAFTLAALLPSLAVRAQGDDAGAVSLAEAFFLQRGGRDGGIELFGTLLIWLLIAASAASIALIILRFRENKRELIRPESLASECRRLAEEGALDRALRRAEESETDLGALIAAALREREPEAAARAIEQAADVAAARRLRRIEPLSVIGGVAPMVGLFGTVYGMILAFREIVAAGGAPDPVGLAAGIGTALTTTFWGLVVAIPALIGFGALRNAIDAHIAGAEQDAESVLHAAADAEAADTALPKSKRKAKSA